MMPEKLHEASRIAGCPATSAVFAPLATWTHVLDRAHRGGMTRTPGRISTPFTSAAGLGRTGPHRGALYVSGGALGYAHGVSEALLTLSELADTTRHVVAGCEAAVIADGGVGFGDAVHVARTITEVEATGAAAIEIEDQVAPKRVSHHRGIEHLVAPDEMAAKVEYAVKARRDEDFLIIARTGAVRNESFDAAVDRANLYREAGADVLMLMPTTDAQWIDAPKRINGPLASITSLDLRSKAEWQAAGLAPRDRSVHGPGGGSQRDPGCVRGVHADRNHRH